MGHDAEVSRRPRGIKACPRRPAHTFTPAPPLQLNPASRDEPGEHRYPPGKWPVTPQPAVAAGKGSRAPRLPRRGGPQAPPVRPAPRGEPRSENQAQPLSLYPLASLCHLVKPAGVSPHWELAASCVGLREPCSQHSTHNSGQHLRTPGSRALSG